MTNHNQAVRRKNNTSRLKAIASAALLGLMSYGVSAQSLHVIDDTYADSANSSMVMNSQLIERKSLLVANTNAELNNLPAGERIAYFKHEMETLPSNLTSENVSKASIRVWVSEVIQEGTLLVHLVEQDWDEANLNYDNRPSITPFFAAVNVTAADANHWLTIDVTKQFMDWANLPLLNYGIAFTAAEAPNNQGAIIKLSSKEGVYVDTTMAQTTLNAQLLSAKTGSHNDDERTCDDGKDCEAKKQCEADRKAACHKYYETVRKAKYTYIRAIKLKTYCTMKKLHCEKYEEAKRYYIELCELARKYKQQCQDASKCKHLCDHDDNGDDDNNGSVAINVIGSTGHPAEMEVVLNTKELDIVAKSINLNHAAGESFDSQDEQADSILETELDLAQKSQVMYMATLSVKWTQAGKHTLRCEAALYPTQGDTIISPAFEKTLGADMSADIITINSSSFGAGLMGYVKVEVYCDITDANGNAVDHQLNGTISTWAVPTNK